VRRRFTNGRVLRVVALTAWALLTIGCSASSTTLDVQADFDATVPQSVRDQAMRVDTYLVASCADVSMGDPPASSVASTFVLRDGSTGTFGGSLEPGQYGLYAFARDAACVVVAAGCDGVTIGAGMEGPLLVTLTEFTGTGCPLGQLCSVETGECLGQDGDVNACDATCDTCDTGCCRDDCGGAGAVCDLSCNDCTCGFDCRKADSCTATCTAGADCQVDCRSVTTCDVTCSAASTCQIDCKGAESCDQIRCTDGSACELNCDGAVPCAFAECSGGSGVTVCSADKIVCNRAC